MRVIVSLVWSLCLLLAAASQAQQQRLRILVTNDDGYDSPGLLALVSELAALGEVTVAAPRVNMSGSSHSVGSLGGPINAERVEIAGAAAAWAVDATPAVSAMFGLLALGGERPFDLLVSGINRGANVGAVAHMSGTVGAAMEGIYRGVPAIAVSQDALAADYTRSARVTARLVRALSPAGFPLETVISINVPARATSGEAPVVVAPMGGSYVLVSGLERVSEDGARSSWRPRVKLLTESTGLAGTDTGAYLNGAITITPLRFDWTDRDLFGALERVAPALAASP